MKVCVYNLVWLGRIPNSHQLVESYLHEQNQIVFFINIDHTDRTKKNCKINSKNRIFYRLFYIV